MFILSWDCAHKSLAYCYIEIKNKSEDDDRKVINVLACDVVDILSGSSVKEVDPIQKAILFKKHLKAILDSINIDPSTRILIEDQPSRVGFNKTNAASQSIANFLVYSFCDNFEVILVSPKLKQNICLKKGLEYLTIYNEQIKQSEEKKGGQSNLSADAKARIKYSSRKKMSVENFTWFMTQTGQMDKIKHIKKAYLDDVSDTFLQVLAKLELKVYISDATNVMDLDKTTIEKPTRVKKTRTKT